MDLVPLILASASPRRSDLLIEGGYPFAIVPAEVEEEHEDEPASLAALVEANAALKARWVSATLHPDAICVGADTLVSIDGNALGKPADRAEAEAMLSRLVGRTHQVCTGVCLTRAAPAKEKAFHVVTDVTFLPLDQNQIQAYLDLINPLDKAGAYAAQEHGEKIIEKIDGSWTNVVGLPMERFAVELADFRD